MADFSQCWSSNCLLFSSYSKCDSQWSRPLQAYVAAFPSSSKNSAFRRSTLKAWPLPRMSLAGSWLSFKHGTAIGRATEAITSCSQLPLRSSVMLFLRRVPRKASGHHISRYFWSWAGTIVCSPWWCEYVPTQLLEINSDEINTCRSWAANSFSPTSKRGVGTAFIVSISNCVSM